MSSVVAVNRKARHEFFIYDKWEAGIVLVGSEVKAIREGKVNLQDAYVRLAANEVFLVNCHITPYSKIQGYTDLSATRSRKLLLNRAEIDKISSQVNQKGFTLVPLQIYFKHNMVKVEIALAKGKKEFDKRADIKKKIHDRETSQAVKKHTQRNR